MYAFPAKKPVAIWLFSCAFMVFLMVVIGGLTRLTASGLSIVEWKPVAGIIPPLSEQTWLEEFAKYQKTPEYLAINFDMNLQEFKSIFVLEYVHRLLGRLVGIVFFVPLVYFSLRNQLNKTLVLRLSAIFLLGGLQGAIGWYMVKSGLEHDPHVSHYRLALHLGTAFVIEGWLLWIALSVWRAPSLKKITEEGRKIQGMAWVILLITGLIFFQVVSGAFVAGLHAGLIYNTFPLMDGQLIPNGIWTLTPWYHNLLENITTVQFTHRLSAFMVAFAILGLWIKVQCNSSYFFMKNSVNFLMIMLIIQLTLGITTLLYHVPIPLASLHQAGAMVLLSLSIYCLSKMYGKVDTDIK